MPRGGKGREPLITVIPDREARRSRPPRNDRRASLVGEATRIRRSLRPLARANWRQGLAIAELGEDGKDPQGDWADAYFAHLGPLLVQEAHEGIVGRIPLDDDFADFRYRGRAAWTFAAGRLGGQVSVGTADALLLAVERYGAAGAVVALGRATGRGSSEEFRVQAVFTPWISARRDLDRALRSGWLVRARPPAAVADKADAMFRQWLALEPSKLPRSMSD